MNNNLPMIEKEKRGFRKIIKDAVEIIKSKLDKNYILSANSPESLKKDKKLILKTLKTNPNYLDQVSEDILLEELTQPNLPENGIISSAFKNGYYFSKYTAPNVLLGEQAKGAILEYIRMQENNSDNIFAHRDFNAQKEKLTNFVEGLDESLFFDDVFREEVLDVAMEKGYKIRKNSPAYLLGNGKLAESYYKELFENNPDRVLNENILNSQLLKDKEFLEYYLDSLCKRAVEEEIIIDTLIHNEECKNTLKNDLSLFKYVFDTITPSNLEEFFVKFFSDEELNQLLLNNEGLQGRLLRLSKLYAKDDSVIKFLDGRLLDEKYANIPQYKMQIIAKNPNFQDEILKLNDYQYILYSKMTQQVENKTNRWNRFEENIVRNLSDGYFNELVNDLYEEAKKGNRINSSDIETLTFIFSKESSSKSLCNEYFSNPHNREGKSEKELKQYELLYWDNNVFNITKKIELEHFKEIKELVCDTVLINPDLKDEEITGPVNKYLGKFKALPELDRMKLALLEKYYNMDLSETKEIVDRYASDIDNIVVSDEYQSNIVEQIRAIKNIFESGDMNVLKQIGDMNIIVETDLSTSTYLIEESKEMFEQLYKENLYMPKEGEKIGTTTYDGKNIEIFDANTDIAMIVKRVDANDKDSKEIWNSLIKVGEYERKDLRYYTSTSYMTDENLLHGNMGNQIILGFGEGTKNYSFDGVYKGDAHTPFYGGDGIYQKPIGSTYVTPDTLETNTDNQYNEVVINTLSVDENGQMTKMQPDYIVYIKNESNISIEELENDNVWMNSKKAASEFGVPIVVVDREKIRESERTKIAEMSEKIKSTSSSNEILKFVKKVEHYSSRYGVEDISKLKFVSKEKMKFLREHIVKKQEEEQKGIFVPNINTNTEVGQTMPNRESILKRQRELKETNIIDGDESR